MNARTLRRPTFAALRRDLDGYRTVLLLLMALYVLLFTGMAWRLHAGMRTHKADLGQIDQAIWNSSRGRFVEMTDNGYIATRMSDHVEPILALISPIYWVWNDVRAILLLQVLFVAVGAWLLYELTQLLFEQMVPPGQRYIWQIEPLRAQSRPLGLALAAAYLLAPQLQSALLTEFHAAPLAPPLILWALLSVERRHWAQFIAAALLTALVKEEMALLAAGLGVWAVWREVKFKLEASKVGGRQRRDGSRLPAQETKPVETSAHATNSFAIDKPPFTVNYYPGVAVTVISLVWFYLATFVIVPAHAAEVYGVAESGYFQRYGALGDSPVDILKSFFAQPALVWQIATEPARLRYVVNLLMVFGFLSVLGPELLLLALPVFLANLLSAYPAQYYGEFHYSAPLVPYVAAAAAFGVSRMWRMLAQRTDRSSAAFQHLPAARPTVMAAAAFFTNARTTIRPLATLLLTLWIIGWASFAYSQNGRGPLGGRYDPTAIAEHHRLLARFVDQLPPDATVTATAAVHPHVSHRRYVYQFPLGIEATGRKLGNAEWALIDVTTNTDMAPGDLYARVQAMLADDWGVVDGADGLLLLHKGDAEKEIPDAFYDFARDSSATVAPTPLNFAGTAVDDWPRWRQTRLTLRWQVGEGFDPAAHMPYFEVRTPAGERLYSAADGTAPALYWYPPTRWQPGETIKITSLPLYLPRSWGVAANYVEPDRAYLPSRDDLALVAAYQREPDGTLIAQGRPDDGPGAGHAAARFAPGASPLHMEAWVPQKTYAPGEPVDVHLAWGGTDRWPNDATVFVHLRAPDGQQQENDGLPRYFVPYDIDQQLQSVGRAPDWRQPALPATAQPGEKWEIVTGLYAASSGERFELIDASSEPDDNAASIATIRVTAPPTPDQACALFAAACASQP